MFYRKLVFVPPYIFFVNCAVLLFVIHNIEKELSEIKKST
jgi:hypothetical protein